jgi:hypothetical protein
MAEVNRARLKELRSSERQRFVDAHTTVFADAVAALTALT